MTPQTAVATSLAEVSAIEASAAAPPPTVASMGAVPDTETAHAVVAVVGLGYVGLPTAIAMRNAGCRIIGIDVSAGRLQTIRAGEAELLESEQAHLREHLTGDGFALTDNVEALEAADLAILATVHPGHDYGWLARCPAVLDCTYRTPGGRRRFLP